MGEKKEKHLIVYCPICGTGIKFKETGSIEYDDLLEILSGGLETMSQLVIFLETAGLKIKHSKGFALNYNDNK